MKNKIVRFGELYQIPSSNGLSRPSAVRGSGFKMINMGELFANNIISDIPMERVQMSENEQKKFLVEQGDLLFARQSLVAEGAGKCSIVKLFNEPTTFESHLIRVRLNQKIANPWYYYYLFQLKSNPIKAIINQCAQAGIRGSELVRVKVPNPPLPTQQKIASILSAYDNLIQNYKKQIEALQTAASELYKEWFVRFRFPGYLTTRFENGIPEGWKVYRIKDLCYINKNTVSSKDAKKEILYLDTGSITENVIDSFESYTLEDAPSRARRVVKKNSIIFSTVRPNQNHYGLLKAIPENLIVSTGFAVFDTKFDIANILYFFLSSKDFIDYCQMIAEGAVATYPSIKPEEIGKVKILLPTMDLAIKLNHSFESLFLKIENLKQQITNLTQQRDLLLPRLMSGKLEVK